MQVSFLRGYKNIIAVLTIAGTSVLVYDRIPRKPKIGFSQAKYVETNIDHSKFAHVHKMQGNSIHNFHHRGKIITVTYFASDLDVAKNSQLDSGKATMYFYALQRAPPTLSLL